MVGDLWATIWRSRLQSNSMHFPTLEPRTPPPHTSLSTRGLLSPTLSFCLFSYVNASRYNPLSVRYGAFNSDGSSMATPTADTITTDASIYKKVLLAACRQLPAACCLLPAACYLLPAACCQLPAASCLLPAASYLLCNLLSAICYLLSAVCSLPSAVAINHLLSAIYCLLTTVCCRLSTVCCLLSTFGV
jgi:hypothetical protein